MFNLECWKIHGRWSLKSFTGMLLKEHPGGFVFFWAGLSEKGAQFFLGGHELHKNYVMVVILLSFSSNFGNLTLKLHQEKRSYPEGWFFIGRFKVGSVPGKSVAFEAFKKKVLKSIMNMMQGH